MAPDSIRFACRRIAGMAMLPTAEAPVKNFAISTHPPPSSLETKKSVDPSAKNKHGIGTNTYIRADNIGHQLLYRAQARICKRMLAENINAKPASTDTCNIYNPRGQSHRSQQHETEYKMDVKFHCAKIHQKHNILMLQKNVEFH